MTREERDDAISINSMVETIATKVTEDTEKFIFETITPYCEEITKREISKKDLKRALTQYFSKEPCDDAISREAVKEIVNDIRDCISVEGYWAILERLKKLPSVTQKSGKWINDKNDIPICSRCGYIPQYDRAIDDYEYSNYCPSCGAKMESEDRE